jgi:hypothetical protein
MMPPPDSDSSASSRAARRSLGVIIALIVLCLAVSAFMDWIDPHFRHTVVARGLIFAPIILAYAVIKDIFG